MCTYLSRIYMQHTCIYIHTREHPWYIYTAKYLYTSHAREYTFSRPRTRTYARLGRCGAVYLTYIPPRPVRFQPASREVYNVGVYTGSRGMVCYVRGVEGAEHCRAVIYGRITRRSVGRRVHSVGPM